MAATKAGAPNAPAALDFDAIRRRTEALGIDFDSLHKFLGYHKTTVWRWQNGLTVPNYESAQDVADKLGVPLDDIRLKRGNPTPPPPPGPSSPPAPPGPRDR